MEYRAVDNIVRCGGDKSIARRRPYTIRIVIDVIVVARVKSRAVR